MRRAELAARVAAFALVVAAVVGAAGVASLTDDGNGRAEPEGTPVRPSAFAAGNASAPLAAEGRIDPAVPRADRGGVVVIDVSHDNRLSRAELAPLVEGLTATGHAVEFHREDDNLGEQLADADGFVVIAPGQRYSGAGVRDLKRFTDRGGRLLLVGEPDRVRPREVPRVRSVRLTTVASAYGFSFGTRYLYSATANDGNYKHVVARPPPAAGVEAVGRTVHYTATTVSARNGTPVLVTAAGTRLSEGGPPDRYPVAVRRGNVLAVGDATFLRADRYTVADNDAFVEYLIGFLAAGERGSPERVARTVTVTRTVEVTPAGTPTPAVRTVTVTATGRPTPGFGIAAAVIALLAATLLARRRG